MAHALEGELGRGIGEGALDRALEPCRDRDVLDGPAGSAHQVMVVRREVLRELVPRDALLGDHAADGAHLLEDREVPIHGALRQGLAPANQVRRRRRSPDASERLDEVAPLRRVALSRLAEAGLDGDVEVVRHGAVPPVRSRSATPRRASVTTAKHAAAISTIVPPGASPQIRESVSPTTTEPTPMATLQD